MSGTLGYLSASKIEKKINLSTPAALAA